MIIGIVGNQGRGKTALMARMALHYSSICSNCNGYIQKDRIIQSLYTSIHQKCECEQPKPYKIHANFWLDGIANTHFVTTLEDIDRIHLGYFFADELWSWIDSRGSGFDDINAAITDILMKVRKRGYHLIYESKRLHMTDRRIREMTDYVLIPEKYIEYDGELVKIEHDLLYPINLTPYIDKTWIIAEMIDSYNEKINEIQFKLSEVVDIYNTNEEIIDLRTGERSPGLEKGMLIESEFERSFKKMYPAAIVIPHEPNSRGWDSIMEINNSRFVFDVVTHEVNRNTITINIRDKKIIEMCDYAAKIKSKPFFAWHQAGNWMVMEIKGSIKTNKARTTCRTGYPLTQLLEKNKTDDPVKQQINVPEKIQSEITV